MLVAPAARFNDNTLRSSYSEDECCWVMYLNDGTLEDHWNPANNLTNYHIHHGLESSIYPVRKLCDGLMSKAALLVPKKFVFQNMELYCHDQRYCKFVILKSYYPEVYYNWKCILTETTSSWTNENLFFEP